jgi:nucleoid-associated protein YgaU
MADRKTTKKRPVRSLGRKQLITPEEKSRAGFGGLGSFLRLGESYTSMVLGIIVVIAVAALLVSFGRSGPKAPEISKKEISATHTVNTQISPITTPQSESTQPTVVVTEQPATVTPTPVVTKQIAQATATPAPTKQPASIPAGGTYTVQAGDDLWKIAEKTYNDGHQWTAIAKANNITNPNLLVAGAKLKLPQKQTIAQNNVTPTPQKTVTVTPTVVAKAQLTPTPTIADNHAPTGPPVQRITGSTYTVKPGDTLWDIAVRAYGNGYKWADIAKANNLQNPNTIHNGNVFTLPQKG